jgi:hypothetical protein
MRFWSFALFWAATIGAWTDAGFYTSALLALVMMPTSLSGYFRARVLRRSELTGSDRRYLRERSLIAAALVFFDSSARLSSSWVSLLSSLAAIAEWNLAIENLDGFSLNIHALSSTTMSKIDWQLIVMYHRSVEG